jgi:hypothetical protein
MPDELPLFRPENAYPRRRLCGSAHKLCRPDTEIARPPLCRAVVAIVLHATRREASCTDRWPHSPSRFV